MRKPACGSVACTCGAATKSPVHLMPDSRAVKVMTFETARMRTESEMLLGSKLQLTQAMRDVSAVGGIHLSTGDEHRSSWLAECEGLGCPSSIAYAGVRRSFFILVQCPE